MAAPNKPAEIRLSEAKIFKLAKLYLNYECLWKTTNQYYKNRVVRNHAYMEICKAMNIPNLHWREIPKKIKNVRSSYYQELKRIEMSIQGGASPGSAYTPRVMWFPIIDGIIKTIDQADVNTSHQNEPSTVNNIKEECIDSENPTSVTVVNYENSSGSESDNFVQNDSSSNDINDPLIQESDIEKNIMENASSRKRTIKFISPSKHSNRRKRFKTNKHQEKDDDVTSLITKLEKVTEELQMKLKPDNEFDVFGKYIAMTLKNMPLETSLIARNELQKTLCAVQLKALRNNKRNINIETSDEPNPNMEDFENLQE